MPTHVRLRSAYEANPYGRSDTFSKTGGTFSATELRRSASKIDSDRQTHFESQLSTLAAEIGSHLVPVFVDWDGKRRMDRGCIGHSIARGFLQPPVDNKEGWLEFVTISNRD